jgi:hypothetical protein
LEMNENMMTWDNGWTHGLKLAQLLWEYSQWRNLGKWDNCWTWKIDKKMNLVKMETISIPLGIWRKEFGQEWTKKIGQWKNSRKSTKFTKEVEKWMNLR